MSLLDSLLLEGYRDPREIYVSLRADGQKGSGTIDDPYDGGTRIGPVLSATLSFDRKDFIVFTSGAHGYEVNDTVRLSNVAFPMGPSFNELNATITDRISNQEFVAQLSNLQANPSPGPPTPTLQKFTEVRKTAGASSAPLNVPITARLYWPIAKVTSAGHGLVRYDAVAIAGTSDPLFAGQSVAVAIKDNDLYVVLTTLPVLTTGQNCTCAKVNHRFDAVMRTVPPNSVIHIGCGTFETRGFSLLFFISSDLVYVGYLIKTGQKLRGSGMGLTTLKLVHALDSFAQTTAVANEGSAPVLHFEASDFTVDCNLPEQPVPSGTGFAGVTCGAIFTAGGHTRLHRIRTINFGCQAPPECFVLFTWIPYVDVNAAVHNVIEDCVAEQPSENNTHETSTFPSVGGFYGSAISPIVRHNYVNCSFTNSVSSEWVWIDKIEYGASDTEAVVTTKRPHQRVMGHNASLNFVFHGEILSVFHAPFPITAVLSSTQFKINKPAGAPPANELIYDNPVIRAYLGVSFQAPVAALGTGCVTEGNAVYDCIRAHYHDTGSTRHTVVRDNYYSNIGLGVEINFPGDVFDTARGFLGTSAIVPENAPEDSGYKHGVFTTIQPHGLSVNDTVTIREGGEANPQTGNAYHGSGLVKAIRSANQFVYRLDQSAPLPTDNCPGRPVFWPAASAIAISTLSYDPAPLKLVTVSTGSSPHGLVDGDFLTIVGANPSSFDGFVGPIIFISPTQFTFPRDMGTSSLTGSSGTLDRHVAAGIVRSGSVATVTTVSAHGFFHGQVFKIQGAFVNGAGDTKNRFYGVVTVKSFTARTFSYDMKALPSGTTDPDPTGSVKSPTGPVAYAAHWDIRHFVIENNIYDLYASDANSAFVPRAVAMYGLFATDIPPYIFPAFVYRNNLIRHIDEQPGAIVAGNSDAIYATTIGNGLIENNVFDTGYQPALIYYFSGKLAHLQNLKPNGSLVRGYRSTDVSGPPIDDLEAQISDALAMALL